MTLMAQAVPSATRLPCVSNLPYGWGVGIAETIGGYALFGVGVGVGDGSGEDVIVSLTGSCPPPVEGTEHVPIEGGCVTYRSAVDEPGVPTFEPGGGLSLVDRADLVAAVARDDQVLCGASAPACP